MPTPHVDPLTGNTISYKVPQVVIDDVPSGHVYIHLAWFAIEGGRYIGEWAGYLPSPVLSPADDRNLVLDAWLHDHQQHISPDACAYYTVDEDWDREAFEACPRGGAACLDVTRFHWPVGDHVWHRWIHAQGLLDWPDSAVHRYIEVDMKTMQVVANQSSHRPVRAAVPGQCIIDVTGTALDGVVGSIEGRFVRCGAGWAFERSGSGEMILPDPVCRQLTEAPVTFDVESAVAAARTRVRELVHA